MTEQKQDFSLGKAYKLCNKKHLELLFQEKNTLKAFPIIIYYREVEYLENVPFQIVFSVGKKNFKRAHDRNYIKRLMREVFRHRKDELINAFGAKSLHFGCVFMGKDLPTLKEMQKSLDKILHKLKENK